MPAIPVPTKTPLGQEELRRRTGGLGQRHRTLLFLIDGRRPLSEVLSLALQAGAATSHFEDLVRLGFVEMPAEEPPAPPPEVAHAPAQVQITHLEVEVPVPALTPAERAEPVPAEDMAPFAPTQVQDDPEPEGAMLTEPAVLAVAVPPPLPPAPPPAPPAPLRPQTYAQAPPPVPPAAPPARHAEELPVLERARDSLLEALRHDAQPSGSRQVAERLRSVTTPPRSSRRRSAAWATRSVRTAACWRCSARASCSAWATRWWTKTAARTGSTNGNDRRAVPRRRQPGAL